MVFTLNTGMARLSAWNSGRRSNNYRYADKMMSQWLGASGTYALVHKYIGVYTSEDDNSIGTGELTIQDVLTGENRDRKYSDEIYEIMTIYNVNDLDSDLTQFGIFLTNDTIYLEFHINDSVARLGRKFMNGDVIELPHLRDENGFDQSIPAVNKFYVITDVTNSSSGFSPTWYPHFYRVKCEPLVHSQETDDLFQKDNEDSFGLPDGKLEDILTNKKKDFERNEAVVDAAKKMVSGRNFQTQQFYVVPGDELGGQYPWIFAGDGIPPNGAELLGKGNRYPDNAPVGSYFLRTDYFPETLFRKTESGWKYQEVDYREDSWSPADRYLRDHINNNDLSSFPDGRVERTRVSAHEAVMPKIDK